MLVVFCFVSHWKYHLVFQEDWNIFFWFTALRFLNSFESNLNKKFSRKLVRLCSHVEISKPFYYEFLEQTANFSDNFFFRNTLIQFAVSFFFFIKLHVVQFVICHKVCSLGKTWIFYLQTKCFSCKVVYFFNFSCRSERIFEHKHMVFYKLKYSRNFFWLILISKKLWT